MIKREDFGKMLSGKDVYLFILDNGRGLKAEILNYGGIVKNLFVTDKNGKYVDVVLGRDTFEDYLNNFGFYGAAIGRHANRIANARFELGGKIYTVGANEGKNSLHGGLEGFDKKLWDVETLDGDEPALVLSMISPDMEEGFPGTLKVIMTYTLTKENAFKINYRAVSDKDTVVNLTNHSYFNLAGHASGKMTDQVLQIFADFYTPNCSECMPTGEVLSVAGTPFDFRTPKKVGQDINADHKQIQMFGGYDHNFALDGRGYRLGAVLSCLENGITMEMYTDKPAVQLYTTNGVEKGRICKDGTIYEVHQALCLETQFFPNAMKFSHYPSPILNAGEEYNYTTEYRFIVNK
ncbi:MAG: galactose mutarotase [Clostridia bacterium]|nr:galactose mutarotase [Clostridia bacterium]